APLHGLACPVDGPTTAGRTAALGDHLAAPGVDRADNRLGAELVGQRAQELRPVDRRLVDGDLVGARTQEATGVLERGDPTADGERDLELRRGVLDEVEQRPASFDRRGDIEKDELVRAKLRVARRQLDRVSDLAQTLEPDALDDAAAGDVEAGNHALLDHATAFRRIRAPGAALRPGP